MKKLIIAAAVSVALSGCGGSSAPDDYTDPDKPVVDPVDTPKPEEVIQLPGTGIDGYIQGATAFLDENFNSKLTTGEPNDITDAEGNFTLEVYASNICATTAPIFMNVPKGAYDSDAPNGVVEKAYVMATPPIDFINTKNGINITPITTKVWNEVKIQAEMDGVELSCESLSGQETKTWMESAVKQAEEIVINSLVESDPDNDLDDITQEDLYSDYIESGESALHDAAKEEVEYLQKTEELQDGDDVSFPPNSRVLSKSEYSKYKLTGQHDFYMIRVTESVTPSTNALIKSIEVTPYDETNKPVVVDGHFSYHYNKMTQMSGTWGSSSSSEMFVENGSVTDNTPGSVLDENGNIIDEKVNCIQVTHVFKLDDSEEVTNERLFKGLTFSYEDEHGDMQTGEYYTCEANPDLIVHEEKTLINEVVHGFEGETASTATYNYDKNDLWSAGGNYIDIPNDFENDVNAIFANLKGYEFSLDDIDDSVGKSDWDKTFSYIDGTYNADWVAISRNSDGKWLKTNTPQDGMGVLVEMCLEGATYQKSTNNNANPDGSIGGDRYDAETGTYYDVNTDPAFYSVLDYGEDINPVDYWHVGEINGTALWHKSTQGEVRSSHCDIQYSAWDYRGTQSKVVN